MRAAFVGLQQSKYAYADMRRPEPWGICDRCGFRYFHHQLRWQFDWRGNQMQNLRILVDHRCEDEPQPQLRPIIVGPDPYPVKDPRPGWAASQMGPQPPPYQGYQPDGPGGGGTVGGFLTTDQGFMVTDDLGQPIDLE